MFVACFVVWGGFGNQTFGLLLAYRLKAKA